MNEDAINRILESNGGVDEITGQLFKFADLKNYREKPVTESRRRKNLKNISTQADGEMSNMAKECVQNWLFTQAEEATIPPKLEISKL